jgi:universal stress protein F
LELKRILVGVDGSPRERAVLGAAQDLALRYDARLTLMRAVGLPPEIPSEAWQNPTLTVQEFLEAQARRGLESLARDLPDGLLGRHELEVVVSTAWQALCTGAQSLQANLIVIGSHGYGGLDRVLGTTAARVVNHALCSVLVVRTPADTTLPRP